MAYNFGSPGLLGILCRVAGPTTGVVGSNPLESVNRYHLYYMKAETPIQFSGQNGANRIKSEQIGANWGQIGAN